MNIGIISLPLHTNYGGILQGYALSTILIRNGHNAKYIQKLKPVPHYGITNVAITAIKRFVSHILKGTTVYRYNVNTEIKQIQTDYKVHAQHIQKFIKNYIDIYEVNTFSDIKKEDFDAYVVGSDQVWRPRYFGEEDIAHAFLSFAETWNIRRIAFAPSFGTDTWEYSNIQTTICKKLLENFDAVSCREEGGVTLCKEHFGIDAVHVLDPTMLLDKGDYLSILDKSNLELNDTELLCYVLDQSPDVQKVKSDVIYNTGYTPFELNSRFSDLYAPMEERIQKPVEQWIKSFTTAKMVVTDSFHACVFSIIFNVPFWVVSNKDRGTSRIESLLRMFNLLDRMICDTKNIQVCAPIDWKVVNDILCKQKQHSLKFLLDAINNE